MDNVFFFVHIYLAKFFEYLTYNRNTNRAIVAKEMFHCILFITVVCIQRGQRRGNAFPICEIKPLKGIQMQT